MKITQVHVADFTTRLPISGAHVILTAPSGTVSEGDTDADGNHCFAIVEDGKYFITATKAKYNTGFKVPAVFTMQNSRFNAWLGTGSTNAYNLLDVGTTPPCDPNTEPSAPQPECQYVMIGQKTITPLGDISLTSTNIIFPYSVAIVLAGQPYTIFEGIPLSIPGAILDVSSISQLGAKICMTLVPLPPPPPPPTPPPPQPGGEMPPPPELELCEFPTLSLNFIDVMSGLAKWIMCTLRNILAQIVWIVSVLNALIPRILEFLFYVLSLQWLEDSIKRFFEELDIWISNKFGIDPALPFWDELIKKTITWIAGGVDEAAARAIQRLK